MAIQQALEHAIHEVAPTAVINIRFENGHFSGVVIADEFAQLNHLARQRQVWETIRRELGPEAAQVGTLLLYTRDEADAVEEDEEVEGGEEEAP